MLLGNYGRLIDFIHHSLITVIQEKASRNGGNIIEKNVLPLPRFSMVNVCYKFRKILFHGNTAELCILEYA